MLDLRGQTLWSFIYIHVIIEIKETNNIILTESLGDMCTVFFYLPTNINLMFDPQVYNIIRYE